MMKSREFTQLLVGAVMLPSAANAQGNAEGPRVGFVYTEPKQTAAGRVDAIVSGIRARVREFLFSAVARA
jgi:hypothetical protein